MCSVFDLLLLRCDSFFDLFRHVFYFDFLRFVLSAHDRTKNRGTPDAVTQNVSCTFMA